MDITAWLFEHRDQDYQRFQAGLIPNISPESLIGVRMPQLRILAKELKQTADADVFMQQLPHQYYEENILQSLLINTVKDTDRCIAALDTFLPYVDNWAVCDAIVPASFKKHPVQLLPKVHQWIGAEHTYTIRFGIGVLMHFYLDDAFSPEYPAWVAAVQSEEYYVRMMIAWYFATALAKQPEAAMPYLTGEKLDPWSHRKTIQKAIESYRIPAGMKEELRKMREKR